MFEPLLHHEMPLDREQWPPSPRSIPVRFYLLLLQAYSSPSFQKYQVGHHKEKKGLTFAEPQWEAHSYSIPLCNSQPSQLQLLLMFSKPLRWLAGNLTGSSLCQVHKGCWHLFYLNIDLEQQLCL